MERKRPVMTPLQAHPSVVYTPLDESEAILLHLETKRYYSLNETGRRIWELAVQGRGAEAIADTLVEEYAVSRETAEAKARRLLDDLSHERLLIR